ncbi:hypothetical protein [Petroclostridium sp. X23]|uniref:hypothetical protein n=1 Tax=Petroclostridium sp. X23 TaxID=3045146 RepID=UPI0024ADCE14|nr:hypothetical protein [Petroclostridium sp. X23]WHH61501.1 hypothetical protein QKW49_12715 [Petroclostridium sp. X23]
MYNFIQQAPEQYYQMPERQDMMYPEYPETYRPLTPGYPSYDMQPTPMYPTTPVYPEYPQTGYPQMGYPQPSPYGQTPSVQPIMPPDVGFEEGPPTLTDIGYTPAYLRTQIGRRVKIEFLLGTNMLVDREGTLVSVGINYVIIQEAETDDLLLCDLYSIKFVKFFY